MLLYGLTVEAAEPAILEYQIGGAPAASDSSEEAPQTFQE